GAGSTLVNDASISDDPATLDPGAYTNTASALTTVLAAQADLGVSKSVNLANAPPGAELTYTITATNHGDSAVTTTVVSDTIAPNTTFLRSSIPAGWLCTPFAGGTLSCP